jgi:hypothetical protein
MCCRYRPWQIKSVHSRLKRVEISGSIQDEAKVSTKRTAQKTIVCCMEGEKHGETQEKCFGECDTPQTKLQPPRICYKLYVFLFWIPTECSDDNGGFMDCRVSRQGQCYLYVAETGILEYLIATPYFTALQFPFSIRLVELKNLIRNMLR